MQDLNVTLIQTALHWQDPAANHANFGRIIADINGPTDLIVLPEMFSTGFTMQAETQAETMDGPSIAWMKSTARQHATVICGSLIIEEDGHFFNRLIWMTPDGLTGYYDKRHLFRMANEQDHYSAGTSRQLFNIKGWRVCPLVCYDLRFPVWSRGANAFDLMIFVANWPATRKSAWNVLLPARAVENQCYSLGLNRIGTDGNEVSYSGDSAVIDYLGNALVNCGDQSGAMTVRLDGNALERYRQKFPAFLDADEFSISS